MKRNDTEERVSARTAFKLTHDEVIEALDMFVVYRGEKVPEGVRNLWFNDASPDCCLTLVVDRDGPAETKAKP